jgi:uncharacterized protein YndB with AHSA1/START domain
MGGFSMFRNSLRAGAIGATMVALSAPAAAEVVDKSADHFVTRDSVTVKAAPKAAWLALIEPAGWWDDTHTWSGSAANLSLVPQGGGCFCERIPEKDAAADTGLAGSAQHMTVVMAEPAKVLRMRGALGPLQSEPVDGVLTVTMQPAAGGGTKLVWEYVVAGHLRYPVDKISAAVDGVMSQQLGHLADKLGRVEEAASAKPAAAPAKPAAAPAASQSPTPKPAAPRPAAPKPAPAKPAAITDDVGAALDAMDDKKDDKDND